jgi:hypothetical protein
MDSFSSWALFRLTDDHLRYREKTLINDLGTAGPSAWTDAVFEELQKANPTLQDLKELSGMAHSRFVGDMLYWR